MLKPMPAIKNRGDIPARVADALEPSACTMDNCMKNPIPAITVRTAKTQYRNKRLVERISACMAALISRKFMGLLFFLILSGGGGASS